MRCIAATALSLMWFQVSAQTESPRARRSSHATPTATLSTTVAVSARSRTDQTSTSAAATSSTRATRMKPTDEMEEAEQASRYFEIAADADLRIGYALTAPTGYYDFDGSMLSWRKPSATDTHYLAVIVQDAGNRWLLGGCKVSATLTDSRGKDTSLTLTETWDPQFRHYGTNLSAADGTTGTLAVKVDPPLHRRRDKVAGAFFTNAASVSFKNVDLSTSTLTARQESAMEPEAPIWPAGRRPYAPPSAR